MAELTPDAIFRQVAEAIPPSCKPHIIIVGSLACGYALFGDKGIQVQTKDVDCLLVPRLVARESGIEITQCLLKAGWKPDPASPFGVPGDDRTPDTQLPAIRLMPPDGGDWKVELLTLPEEVGGVGVQWMRIQTPGGHFGLPSFPFFPLTALAPLETPYGIRCARPEMMALANLLAHPRIGSETYGGTSLKRSNKDLGRVVAIARYCDETLDTWPTAWQSGLIECFPAACAALARQAGQGLRALLESEADLREAHGIAIAGLLSSNPISLQQFAATARRLEADATIPMNDWAQSNLT